MKIKIIDLLVKIANREEMPKKIMYDDVIYTYDEYRTYYDDKGNILWDDYNLYNFLILNDEVEIIEEPKKIEKCKNYEDFLEIDDYIEYLKHKIDELIIEINKLKENN